MDERLSAEENLRVIRTLMERATMYRAISAPTALVAGLLSILAASAIFLSDANLTVGRPIRSRQFAVTWIIVLILSLAANTFFVWREARKTGRPFISPGMKLAFRAIARKASFISDEMNGRPVFCASRQTKNVFAASERIRTMIQVTAN
jgi:hypothetical protein